MDELSIDVISPRFNSGGWAVMSKGKECPSIGCLRDHDIQLAYQGAGTVIIDGVEYPMVKGDVLTIFPGETFYERTYQDSAFARYWIHFDFFNRPEERAITPLIDGLSRWPRLVHLENDILARETCSDIGMLSRVKKLGPLHHILDSKVLLFLGIVIAQYMGVPIGVSPDQLKSRRNVFQVERYIRDNYRQDISVELLAEIANLSPCYLVTIFKKVIGKSPKDYLIDYRMEQARRLLIETDLNVAQVAAYVGYQDASYFSSLFKQKEGIPPSKFAVKFSLDEKYTG